MDLNGVDVDWVRKQLTGFVDETRPINQSGNGLITARTAPECGHPRAIERVEVVRPILRRLYPEWESENPGSKNDEFESARDASRRLLARLDHLDEVNARLGGEDQSPRITASSLHHLIWGAAEAQWTLGQRHEAVLAAAKAVNSQLQAKVNRRDVSEAELTGPLELDHYGAAAPGPVDPGLDPGAHMPRETRNWELKRPRPTDRVRCLVCRDSRPYCWGRFPANPAWPKVCFAWAAHAPLPL